MLEACPVCESRVMVPNGRISWLENDFWYVVCPGCGLKYMNPRPTTQSYRDFYRDYFWQQKIRNAGFREAGQTWQGKPQEWHNEEPWKPEDGRKIFMDKFRKVRVDAISGVLQKCINLGKDSLILEVGCGFPATLEALRDKYDAQVYAIEPSEDARQIIGEKNIELLGSYAEELRDLAAGDLRFDAIIFSHVLENATDPLQVIRWANSCLSANGVIYIQTPNLLVFDQMNPYHPFIFSRNSLRVLIEKAGLVYEPVSQPIDKMLTVICSKKRQSNWRINPDGK